MRGVTALLAGLLLGGCLASGPAPTSSPARSYGLDPDNACFPNATVPFDGKRLLAWQDTVALPDGAGSVLGACDLTAGARLWLSQDGAGYGRGGLAVGFGPPPTPGAPWPPYSVIIHNETVLLSEGLRIQLRRVGCAWIGHKSYDAQGPPFHSLLENCTVAASLRASTVEDRTHWMTDRVEATLNRSGEAGPPTNGPPASVRYFPISARPLFGVGVPAIRVTVHANGTVASGSGGTWNRTENATFEVVTNYGTASVGLAPAALHRGDSAWVLVGPWGVLVRAVLGHEDVGAPTHAHDHADFEFEVSATLQHDPASAGDELYLLAHHP